MFRKIFIGFLLILLTLGYGRGIRGIIHESDKGGRSVPKMLNYQGYLTDTEGIPIDSILDMRFRIYDVETGGTPLWNEDTTGVSVERGVFNVLLGSVDSIPASVFTTGTDRWFELVIGLTDILSPRTRITTMAYAYMATHADTAEYAEYARTGLGIARGGAGNVLYGDSVNSHINFGVACITGTSGQNYRCITVGGGSGNIAAGSYSTIGGGQGNSALWSNATVAGGSGNTANEEYTFIGGGVDNSAIGIGATISGGVYNTITNGDYSTIGGGEGNLILSPALLNHATIAGGYLNTAEEEGTTVSGGSDNTATGLASTICGGQSNSATFPFSVVAGGKSNIAQGQCSFVAGGENNTASGYWATVVGGYNNTASGDYSFAAGRRAKAIHSGSFVWADDEDDDFTTTGNGQFLIRN
jgi:hypothetical protein